MATFDDIPSILALERGAPTASHWSAEQYQSAFSNTTPRRMCLLIETPEGIRGFLVAREVANEWEVENIVIADSRRRQGLGEKLVEEFLRSARELGARSVHLEVRESNIAAQALYAKCKFLQTGRRARYYQDPQEDAMLYALTLG